MASPGSPGRTCARSSTSSFGILGKWLASRRIELRLSSRAADWLAEQVYDASFGARRLKRLMQTQIADKLALQLLEGRFADGDTLTVIADGDGIGCTGAWVGHAHVRGALKLGRAPLSIKSSAFG